MITCKLFWNCNWNKKDTTNREKRCKCNMHKGKYKYYTVQRKKHKLNRQVEIKISRQTKYQIILTVYIQTWNRVYPIKL